MAKQYTDSQIEKVKEIPIENMMKYEDILIHNLRVSLKRANWERSRPGYEMTAQIINKVESGPILEDLFLVQDLIKTKEKISG